MNPSVFLVLFFFAFAAHADAVNFSAKNVPGMLKILSFSAFSIVSLSYVLGCFRCQHIELGYERNDLEHRAQDIPRPSIRNLPTHSLRQ